MAGRTKEIAARTTAHNRRMAAKRAALAVGLDGEEWIRAAHAAEIIGVARQYVQRWIDQGRLHSVRKGSAVLVRLADVTAWKIARDASQVEREMAKKNAVIAQLKRAARGKRAVKASR